MKLPLEKPPTFSVIPKTRRHGLLVHNIVRSRNYTRKVISILKEEEKKNNKIKRKTISGELM